MNRIVLNRVLLFVASLLVAFSVAAETRYGVIPVDSPDPTAIDAHDGSGVYVVTTGRGIPIWHSTNLLDWKVVGRVFETACPEWTREYVPNGRGIWAPDIIYHNGLYHIYYSVSTFGSQRSVIGLAVNRSLRPDDPDNRWEDRGVVLESLPDRIDYNAIDAAAFVDDDGKMYLYWGSYWTGLKGVEIDTTTGKPRAYAEGSLKIPKDYVAVARRRPGHDTSIEAAYLTKREQYYYLWTSRGSCCDGVKSTYHIAIGRATAPLGPFVDRDGERMNAGGGTIILESNSEWKGTGHNGAFHLRPKTSDETTREYIILAAYSASEPEKRRLTQIRPITWDKDGWPLIGSIITGSTADSSTLGKQE